MSAEFPPAGFPPAESSSPEDANGQPGVAAPARAAHVLASHAERWGAWATDPIRRAKSIAPLSSLASFGPRKTRRPLIIAGISVLGLLGGAGAALATTTSPTATHLQQGVTAAGPGSGSSAPGGSASGGSASGPGHMFGHRGFHAGGPMAARGGLGGLLGALHGQAVVPKSGGGFQTVAFQRGQVTAVSASSITVKSADGYSHTYAITSSTAVDAQRSGISSVKTGNQAIVTATVSGKTTTAVSVLDQTLLQQGRAAFGFGHPPARPGSNSTQPPNSRA
jgi:hypothetical protein